MLRIGKSGQYAVVYDMKDVRRDGACQCSLAQGSDGIVYGTAAGGGIYGGGLYFALDAGQPKPAPRPLGFNPRSGGVGTKVSIWGSHLLSAPVRFKGAARDGGFQQRVQLLTGDGAGRGGQRTDYGYHARGDGYHARAVQCAEVRRAERRKKTKARPIANRPAGCQPAL